MKRLFDLTLSLIGIIILAPLFLVVSILIILDDGWPVFFKQERLGLRGKIFRIFKFRTMRVNNGGPLITLAGDSRITKVGHFLRMTKIDELPQLINVLCGEMSLVGPRPEVPRYLDRFDQRSRAIFNFKPGITAPSSLKFSRESEILAEQKNPEDYYVNVLMPEKARLDLEYFSKANFLSDMNLIWQTVKRVFIKLNRA